MSTQKFKLKVEISRKKASAYHSLLGSRRACSPPTPEHQDDGDHDDHDDGGDHDDYDGGDHDYDYGDEDHYDHDIYIMVECLCVCLSVTIK